MSDPNYESIKAVFDTLAPTWGNNDLAGFRAQFELPCLLVLPQGAIPLLDDTAFFASFVGPALIRLKELNFARSTYDSLSVKSLSPTAALASMRWTRRRADDSAIESLGATYALHKGEDTWRSVSVIAHDADTVPTFG